MKKIIYLSNKYPDKRCIINKTKNLYIFKNKKKNISFIMRYILYKFKLLPKEDLICFGTVLGINNIIIHSFNTIIRSNKRVVTTFESTIPRNSYTINRPWEKEKIIINDYQTLKQINIILKKNYLKIIALSQSAYNIEKYMLDNMDISSEKKKNILNKMIVIHPPQDILINEKTINEKYSKLSKNDKLRFIFVGNDFYRKGGLEVVNALDFLISNYGFNLELILITNFSSINYFQDIDDKTHENVLNRICQKNWIKNFSNISNEKVLDLIKISNIGLLPSLADTYGYSVLEMQACGVPVITTNIRALTEINNDNCGWIIKVPVDNIGGEILLQDMGIFTYRKTVTEQLQLCIYNIYQDINQNGFSNVKNKSEYSLKRIKKDHNPDVYKRKLESIYNNK